MKEKHKKYALALLLVSFGVIGVIVIVWELTARPCGNEPNIYSVYCGADNFEQKFHPFLFSFLPLLPITLILFFLRREVFVAWAKFAAVGFPLMLGLMLYAFNVGQTTGGWVGGPTESELALFTLPPLFLIISLAIIGVKWWGLRRQNQKLSG